jgi:hypothetical protein
MLLPRTNVEAALANIHSASRGLLVRYAGAAIFGAACVVRAVV